MLLEQLKALTGRLYRESAELILRPVITTQLHILNMMYGLELLVLQLRLVLLIQ